MKNTSYSHSREVILIFHSFIFHSSLPLLSQRVVPGRVELPTSTLSVWRSNQLSYRTGSWSDERWGGLPGREATSASPFSRMAITNKTRATGERKTLATSLTLFPQVTPLCVTADASFQATDESDRESNSHSSLFTLSLFILFTRQRVSPERRCSSRTFRYGYLVTT